MDFLFTDEQKAFHEQVLKFSQREIGWASSVGKPGEKWAGSDSWGKPIRKSSAGAATCCAANAVQVHGGHGFIKGVKVERLYRDAKPGEHRDGTSEMQRRKIALNLLGEGFR
jgi:hypothetical protein